MRMRTFLCIGLLTLVVAGCADGDRRDGPAPPQRDAARALAGSPPALARIHAQANRLLGGGRRAFEARLKELRGHPVVVNKWASWCGPCRAEFPFFQRQAVERGKEIAFLGVNANDSEGPARRFLAELPVPFPSYEDPDLEVSASFNGVAAFPSTAFYDSKGKLAYLKQGGYATEQKLIEDIERYAR